MLGGIDNFNVAIAIDFGTSRSGYAFAFRWDQNSIETLDKWEKQPMAYPKTLTHLLYSPQREVAAWGYPARLTLAQLCEEPTSHGENYILLQHFKMELLRGQRITEEDGPIIAQDGREFAVVDLIADYLRKLKEVVLGRVKEAAPVLREEEILWCLTVPAIWTNSAKSLMRRAAREAGMIGQGAGEEDRLLLVLEPEAAALCCSRKAPELQKEGTCFMVVDCGGGTTDIVTLRAMGNGKYKEIVKGDGAGYGSTDVDVAFQQYMREKLTSEALYMFYNEKPAAFWEMMANWENRKCHYPGEGSLQVPMVATLHTLLREEFPDVLKRLRGEQPDDERIYLKEDAVHQLFRPTLDGIVKEIDKQFSLLADKGEQCHYIFLVGGFADSPLLKERIRDEFGARTKDGGDGIIIPLHPGRAVLDGAVMYAFNQDSIIRRSRLTYGCRVLARWKEGKDPPEKKRFFKDLGEYRCQDRFKVFVRAGQEVEIDESVIHTFNPVENEQVIVDFDIFATEKQEVRYTDEEGVWFIGKVKAEMPDTTGGVDRKATLAMFFGKTEIQIEARDVTTGKTQRGKIHFSHTQGPTDYVDGEGISEGA